MTIAAMKPMRLFLGNPRVIGAAISLAAVLFSVIGIVYTRRQPAPHPPIKQERNLVAPPTPRSSPPDPIKVTISAALIHVTAISLGDPRMAIINGRLVGEGEQITLHPPAASAVSLRVRKISDGEVELSDATQAITARLELVAPSKPKR
jgi:hypothetical protein